MNEPVQNNQPPSLIPLLDWLEQNKIIQKGSTQKCEDFAQKVKGLGSALRALGLKGL